MKFLLFLFFCFGLFSQVSATQGDISSFESISFQLRELADIVIDPEPDPKKVGAHSRWEQRERVRREIREGLVWANYAHTMNALLQKLSKKVLKKGRGGYGYVRKEWGLRRGSHDLSQISRYVFGHEKKVRQFAGQLVKEPLTAEGEREALQIRNNIKRLAAEIKDKMNPVKKIFTDQEFAPEGEIVPPDQDKMTDDKKNEIARAYRQLLL